ncbi:MAG: argininosuccinate lyase [Acidimicrobiia bacterium]
MTLWSEGRFTQAPAEELWAFTVDHADRRLLVDDVEGSIAHASMLGAVGLLDGSETDAIVAGLRKIAAEAASGSFEFTDGDEDVHSAVERRLGEIVGEIAGKLHTGRSRNDQVALDIRLYLRRSVADRIRQIKSLVGIIVDKAEEAGDTVVASYTHLQQAQAVPLAHQLLSYCWMLTRDVGRFEGVAGRIDVSPLGAGASGGSTLPLDPDAVAARLGLGAVFDNSMDAVGSRDVVAETVWCCTQTMIHLSRLAEDLLLWSSSEFGWVVFADNYTTGSSAMPQKKNADIAELVRGRAAAAIGDLTAIVALQKGLPMTYNRDLQEDKRLVFHADDTLAGSVSALGGMLATASFQPPVPDAAVTALDLAEALTTRGVPFRQAHQVVGRLVATLLADGRTLSEAVADDLSNAHPDFEPGDLDLIDVEVSVANRATPGGGSHESVARQIAALRSWIG